MDYSFGIYADSSGGNGSGGAVGREEFVATDGQTEFTCTTITLTDDVSVFVNGSMQSDTLYTRNGDTITFNIGLNDGDEVVIIN